MSVTVTLPLSDYEKLQDDVRWWRTQYNESVQARDVFLIERNALAEDKKILKDILKATQDALERTLADNKRYLRDLQKAAEFIGDIPADTRSEDGNVAWDLWDETFRAYHPDNWANTNG